MFLQALNRKMLLLVTVAFRLAVVSERPIATNDRRTCSDSWFVVRKKERTWAASCTADDTTPAKPTHSPAGGLQTHRNVKLESRVGFDGHSVPMDEPIRED